MKQLIFGISTFAFVFMMMGMPFKHGVDGRTFGGVVSGLAQTNPSMLVSHVTQ